MNYDSSETYDAPIDLLSDLQLILGSLLAVIPQVDLCSDAGQDLFPNFSSEMICATHFPVDVYGMDNAI